MAAEHKSAFEAFDGANAFNNEAFKDGYEKFSNGLASFADFQKNSMEAMMNSFGIFAKGAEKAAASQATFVKEAFEEGVAAAKAATSTKNVQEAMEIQSNYARTAFEKNLGHATTLADHWTTVAKEAADPIAKRYGEIVEKVQTFRP